MLLICGDALIDFLPYRADGDRTAFVPKFGGSGCNIAIGIGRLGTRVGFLGGLSTDLFGRFLAGELSSAGVDLGYSARLDFGSTLAFVRVEDCEPEYAFFDEGSAGRLWTRAVLPPIGADVTLLHVGSIALISEPAADEYLEMFRSNKGKRVLSLDPNCRPSLVGNLAAYRARMAEFLALADIIKLSVADFAFLMPGRAIDDAARAWLRQGTRLVIVTRGALGVSAFFRGEEITVAAVPTDVKDTVGAGDSYIAGLLAYLSDLDLLSISGLSDMSIGDLRAGLQFASRVASITCSREGADPPWRYELGPTQEWDRASADALAVERPGHGIQPGAAAGNIL